MGNQGVDVYIPCWNINKSSWLTSVDEKNEWVDNIMPPEPRQNLRYIRRWSLAVG